MYTKKLVEAWLEKSIFASSYFVPGGLCGGDNGTVANASHSCSPGYSSLKSHGGAAVHSIRKSTSAVQRGQRA